MKLDMAPDDHSQAHSDKNQSTKPAWPPRGGVSVEMVTLATSLSPSEYAGLTSSEQLWVRNRILQLLSCNPSIDLDGALVPKAFPEKESFLASIRQQQAYLDEAMAEFLGIVDDEIRRQKTD